jgi:hypothetical protein
MTQEVKVMKERALWDDARDAALLQAIIAVFFTGKTAENNLKSAEWNKALAIFNRNSQQTTIRRFLLMPGTNSKPVRCLKEIIQCI